MKWIERELGGAMDITGQVILRQQGHADAGREIVLVCGLLAMPAGLASSYGTQYTLVGSTVSGRLRLPRVEEGELLQDVLNRLHNGEPAAGQTPSSLVTKPIWRF